MDRCLINRITKMLVYRRHYQMAVIANTCMHAHAMNTIVYNWNYGGVRRDP